MEAINNKFNYFQTIANEVVGDDAGFHQEVISDLQRMLAAQALSEYAKDLWFFSEQLPNNWRECVSAYLKAWAAYFDPLTLLELGKLLVKAGYKTEAKEVFTVVLLFPSYADIYYTGERKLDLVKQVTDEAIESLHDLI